MARSGRVWAWIRRALLFTVLWAALVEGDPYGWWYGVVVAAVASSLSMALLPPPPWRLRWTAAPAFVAFFAWAMVLGGIDVAWRAFHPDLPICPGFRTYPLRLDREAERVCLAWAVSLLPGTVSVSLNGNALEYHALDTSQPLDGKLAALETRIAGLFADPR